MFDLTQNNQDKLMNELEIRNETLDEQVKAFFAELNLTPQQLHAFVDNPDNFSKENWEAMQQQKQKLDAKLQLDLQNIRDPLKTKKTYANRKVDQHWLFVR